jgi:hypothetical protein
MFRGAEALRAGRSPYDIPGLTAEPFGDHYKYPLLFAWLLAPATVLSFRPVARAWVVASQALYFAGFGVACRRLGIRRGALVFWIALPLLLVFQPSFDSFLGGQLDALMLLLLALSWPVPALAGAARSGTALALASTLKVYPVVLVTGLITRARWKALAWFGAASLVLWAGPAFALGWHASAQFLSEVMPAISPGTAWLENQSLFGLFSRMFVDGAKVSMVRATLLPAATLFFLVAGALLLATTLWLGRCVPDDRTLYSTLVTATLLVIPNSWMHYEMILLLPLMDLLAREADAPSGRLTRALLAAAAAGIAFGNEDTMLLHPWLPQSYKAWAMLLLWALGMRAMARGRGPGTGQVLDVSAGAVDRSLTRGRPNSHATPTPRR